MTAPTSATRVDPTLSALPPALKKRIIKALEEIDQDSHGDCGSCCGSEDGEGDHDHDHSHKHKGALGDFKELEEELDELAKPVEAMLRNVGNLSLVNKEWFKMCSPFIWQSPDIVERSTESLLYFYHNILPRHAEHIESLFLMQTVERLVEEEDSKFKAVSGSTEEEREAAVLEAVESIAKVSPSNEEEVRTARSRSLVVGEIIKSCPKLYKLDFDAFVLEPAQEPHRDLRDYVLEAAKSHAKSHGSITYLGYSLTPDAVTSYGDVASLLSSYSSTLKSLRIECLSAKGNKQTFLDSLLSLQHLEKLDLGESDFVDDSFADLDLIFPLTHLTLGEYDNLSYPSFTKLVEKFSKTLTNLEVDGSPYAGSDEEELEKASKDLKNPVKLPNLTLLEIATNHKVEVLDKLAYSASKLKELRIGFCPNFDVDETIQFLEKRRDTLQTLEVDLATFSHEELSKLDAVSEELKIEMHVISGGLDEFGLGDDFDEDEEWEDDEEEDEDVHAMD